MATRHLIRTVILQTLYEWDFYKQEKDVTAILERNLEEFAPGIDEPDFAWRILKGVIEHLAEIDEILTKAAPDWPVDKIAVMDRNILRIGLYELLFADHNEVPPRVAINEAIELAKNIYGAPVEPGGFGSAAGEALTTLIRDRPQAIGQAWDLITHGLGAVLSKISGPPTIPGNEAATEPSRLVAVSPNAVAKDEVTVTPAAEPSALGMPPQAVVDDIFGIVVRNFRGGLDGTTVGIAILAVYPKMQPFLQMVCTQELDVVLPELRQQAVIAPILDDARFPEFYAQFREMCLQGLPQPGDFEENASEAAPAAQSDGSAQ